MEDHQPHNPIDQPPTTPARQPWARPSLKRFSMCDSEAKPGNGVDGGYAS